MVEPFVLCICLGWLRQPFANEPLRSGGGSLQSGYRRRKISSFIISKNPDLLKYFFLSLSENTVGAILAIAWAEVQGDYKIRPYGRSKAAN